MNRLSTMFFAMAFLLVGLLLAALVVRAQEVRRPGWPAAVEERTEVSPSPVEATTRP